MALLNVRQEFELAGDGTQAVLPRSSGVLRCRTHSRNRY